MYYAKQIDENGSIIALHSMDRTFPEVENFIPISEEEYLTLLAEFEKAMEEETSEESDTESI